ncbi:MAG TPA: zinc ABC transporter substrate-binding protein [Jatrophihabitantaceae bacterium]|nr:zinc ABC transporter substrate-binding protein [Jatrophihabitantaceae bacterium]
MGARGLAWLAVASVLVVPTVTACQSSAGTGAKDAVSVVASTDVWADVAAQVAGDQVGHAVKITSIINDPVQDPHSYEANARDRIALDRADVVIENGGGYDDFVGKLLGDSATRTTIDAVTVAGSRAKVDGQPNEHVWYDFPTVAAVAGRIADALKTKDPAQAAIYQRNLKSFLDPLAGLEKREARLAKSHAGLGVAITEPVPLYLLRACGLVNRTPAQFSEAVEEGADVAPRVLQQTLALFSTHQVQALVYNEQTVDVATVRVSRAAKMAGIPVVGMTETLPRGQSYLSWMSASLTALENVLGRSSSG